MTKVGFFRIFENIENDQNFLKDKELLYSEC